MTPSAKAEQAAHAPESLSTRLLEAHRRAQASGHRMTVLVSGDAGWTRAIANRILETLPELKPLLLTDQKTDAPSLPLRAAHKLLGRDLGLLVYDAHDGFDPDGFGAATGSIVGGGVLVLLTPPLSHWPTRPDPQAERIAVWPYSADALSGRFLERLTRVLSEDSSLVRLEQGHPRWATASAMETTLVHSAEAKTAAPLRPRLGDPKLPCTPNQQRAVQAVLKTARGRARRPLVLRAHRGRGKSAALGLAAGQLLAEDGRRILVTAPSRGAAETLLRHAHAVLNGQESEHRHRAQTSDLASDLIFVPPAELVETRPHADLLLVDEAAGIPAPLLEHMLRHYGRIVFATTVHGYEGTGRGFDIRFRDRLDQMTPDWRTLEIEQPVRWSAGDPLEALTFRALLLDALPAPAETAAQATPGDCRCEVLDRDALARDEGTLRQVLGLLVLAHYQTRPMDLRMLLDGPNIRVLVLHHRESVVATLLAALEGGFEPAALRDAIYRGQRRPRGHLIPQTLSAHAGLREAPGHRYLRVVRIAVHPAAQGRGLGRALLVRLRADAQTEAVDAVGASFGATPELIRFWDRCGYAPVQIGLSRNAASGEHAAVVLRGTTDAGCALIERARVRLESGLGVLLSGPLRRLDPAVALSIACSLQPPPRTRLEQRRAEEDLDELSCFIEGYRTLEATLPLLYDLSRRYLGECLERGRLDPESAQLLLAATRQLRPPGELAAHFSRGGRDEIIRWLRQAADALRLSAQHDARHLDASYRAVQ